MTIRPRSLDTAFDSNTAAPGPDVAGQPYRLARDPATDQSNAVSLETLGLAGNPAQPSVLGTQVTSERVFFTDQGRPGQWEGQAPKVAERDSDAMVPRGIAAGTIRRNVRYPTNLIQVQALYSWTDNDPCFSPGTLDPLLNTVQDEYVVSSTFRSLEDSSPTVVSGTVKPAPGLEPFRPTPGVMGQPGTGWPVLQPAIPSFGSRIPLLRPRGLVAAGGGGASA